MIKVKLSAIHGRGLFATTLIHDGDVIGELKGEITRDDGEYVLWINDHIGLNVTNDLRFINHSDEPNAAYYDDLTVVAVRDIHPGEEITHDYDGDGDLFLDEEFADWDEVDEPDSVLSA